jgi:hypothetical protein
MRWIPAIEMLKSELEMYYQNNQVYNVAYYKALIRRFENINNELSKLRIFYGDKPGRNAFVDLYHMSIEIKNDGGKNIERGAADSLHYRITETLYDYGYLKRTN